MKPHTSLIKSKYKELTSRFLICFSLCLSVSSGIAAPLEYQEPPIDNPLKGFVPYPDRAAENFYPHSTEFFYVALDEVLTGLNNGIYEFDWTVVEAGLNAAKSRGNQGIFRVYSEYPQSGNEIPEFLSRPIDEGGQGVDVKYTAQFGGSYSPDYQNPAFRAALIATINALADKYDNDDRVAFLELGLLGFWGEWHNHATTSYQPDDRTKQLVIDAYEAAFSETRLLTRYPRGENDGERANYNKPFGYHDDSFHWSTINSFLELMDNANALDKWQSHVIGGEVYPPLNDVLFTDNTYQEGNSVGNTTPFIDTVEASHASYMRLSAVFKENVAASRIARANASVRRMGYNLHFNEATISPTSETNFTVSATLENRGVAPFYYDWPMVVGLLDLSGAVIEEFPVNWLISGIQPNDERVFNGSFTADSTIPAGAQIALRVPNVMEGGRHVRFSNSTQQVNGDAWMVLGKADGLVTTNQIDRSSWIVSGTPNSDEANLAIDGDDSTRWTTEQDQQPGQSFTVTFGQQESFDRIVLDTTYSPNDYPRGYVIQGSNDGINFTDITSGTGSTGAIDITFAPVDYSHVRILQTGTVNETLWWSIGEINVYKPILIPSAPLNRSQWTLSRSGDQSLYEIDLAIDGDIDSRWTTNQVQSPGLDFIIDLGQQESFDRILIENAESSEGDYPRGYIIRGSNDGTNYTEITSGSGTADALDIDLETVETYRYLQIELTENTTFNWWSIGEINVYSAGHANSNPSNEQALKIFIIAGQSNMEGRGTISPLTTQGTLEYTVANDPNNKYQFVIDDTGQWKSFENAWYYYQKSPYDIISSDLSVGQGVTNSYIGPELGFGYIMDSHFKEPILIIKAAFGGRSLGIDFRPPSSSGETGFYYNEILRVVDDATSNLSTYFPDYNGQGYEIVGFGWHQGWSDRADVPEIHSNEYQTNIANFIRDIRQDLNTPELPFVIASTGMGGLYEDNTRALAVMNAQLAIPTMAEFADNTFTIDTRSFYRQGSISPLEGDLFHWHENAASYLDIGLSMGQAMINLLPEAIDLRIVSTADLNQDIKSFKYQRPIQGEAPAIYTIQISNDLKTWSTLAGATETVTPMNSEQELVTVILPDSIINENQKNMFLRIAKW